MIGREALIVLQSLARQQTRIDGGAHDVGIWETLENRKMIRSALAELKSLEGGKASHKFANSGVYSSSYETFLSIEVDDTGETIGTRVKVFKTWHRVKREYFFSISLVRTTRAAYLQAIA